MNEIGRENEFMSVTYLRCLPARTRELYSHRLSWSRWKLLEYCFFLEISEFKFPLRLHTVIFMYFIFTKAYFRKNDYPHTASVIRSFIIYRIICSKLTIDAPEMRSQSIAEFSMKDRYPAWKVGGFGYVTEYEISERSIVWLPIWICSRGNKWSVSNRNQVPNYCRPSSIWVMTCPVFITTNNVLFYSTTGTQSIPTQDSPICIQFQALRNIRWCVIAILDRYYNMPGIQEDGFTKPFNRPSLVTQFALATREGHYTD